MPLKYMPPTYDPQINDFVQLKKRKRTLEILKQGQKLSMDQRLSLPIDSYFVLEKVEPIITLQEASTVITVLYHKSPFVHPYHLYSDDIPVHIQKDPRTPAPSSDDYTFKHSFSISTPLWEKNLLWRSQELTNGKGMAEAEELWHPICPLSLSTDQPVIWETLFVCHTFSPTSQTKH